MNILLIEKENEREIMREMIENLKEDLQMYMDENYRMKLELVNIDKAWNKKKVGAIPAGTNKYRT